MPLLSQNLVAHGRTVLLGYAIALMGVLVYMLLRPTCVLLHHPFVRRYRLHAQLLVVFCQFARIHPWSSRLLVCLLSVCPLQNFSCRLPQLLAVPGGGGIDSHVDTSSGGGWNHYHHVWASLIWACHHVLCGWAVALAVAAHKDAPSSFSTNRADLRRCHSLPTWPPACIPQSRISADCRRWGEACCIWLAGLVCVPHAVLFPGAPVLPRTLVTPL
jgi:hypothetical protein